MILLGYLLTKWSIRPFNDTDLTNNPTESSICKQWNQSLPQLCIFVEHGFGRLKGRFPYLHGIPSNNLSEVYRTIEVLLVIHNILQSIRDDPTTIEGYNGKEDDFIPDMIGDAPEDMRADDLYRQGLFWRKELVQYFFGHEDITIN